MVFEGSARFKPVSAFQKAAFGFLMLLVWVGFYLLSSISILLVQRSRNEPSVVRAFKDLNLAALGDPFNDRIAYAKAVILSEYFNQKGDLDSWTSAMENLKKAEKLNSGFVDGYVLESNLHLALLRKHVMYPALDDEVIAPLVRAERIDPFNPFIKLKKAAVYRTFGRDESARQEALKALALEPEFVSALYFLHENFGYCPDETAFSARMEGIVRKTRRWKLKPGSYLYNLFQAPLRTAPGW
jgi:tetratricopeptide (TPR) repeat protein